MDNVMAQLEGLVAHYEELQEMMADPEVINDTKRYMEISRKKPTCVKLYKNTRSISKIKRN